MNIFTLRYAHVRVRIRGYEIFVFQKIWSALFSFNTRFEIPSFALLPTILLIKINVLLVTGKIV